MRQKPLERQLSKEQKSHIYQRVAGMKSTDSQTTTAFVELNERWMCSCWYDWREIYLVLVSSLEFENEYFDVLEMAKKQLNRDDITEDDLHLDDELLKVSRNFQGVPLMDVHLFRKHRYLMKIRGKDIYINGFIGDETDVPFSIYALLKSDQTTILIPCFVNKDHWTTIKVVVNKASNTLYDVEVLYYNSLTANAKLDEKSQVFITLKKNIITWLQEQTNTKDLQINIYNKPGDGVKQQDDEVACGPIVCQNIINLALEKDKPCSDMYPPGALALRKKQINSVERFYQLKLTFPDKCENENKKFAVKSIEKMKEEPLNKKGVDTIVSGLMSALKRRSFFGYDKKEAGIVTALNDLNQVTDSTPIQDSTQYQHLLKALAYRRQWFGFFLKPGSTDDKGDLILEEACKHSEILRAFLAKVQS